MDERSPLPGAGQEQGMMGAPISKGTPSRTGTILLTAVWVLVIVCFAAYLLNEHLHPSDSTADVAAAAAQCVAGPNEKCPTAEFLDQYALSQQIVRDVLTLEHDPQVA